MPSDAGDHDFGGFHQCGGRLAFAELHLADSIGGDALGARRTPDFEDADCADPLPHVQPRTHPDGAGTFLEPLRYGVPRSQPAFRRCRFMMQEYSSASSERVEGRSTLSDFLSTFDSPSISFLLGIFFLWAGWFRAQRRPPSTISAAGGKYVFGAVGVLLLCNSFFLMWRRYR